jgi:hydrogenase nickel incorporation protein HypB
MCTTCGCGHEEAHVTGHPLDHAHGHDHDHGHDHGHSHHGGYDHSDLRRIAVEEDLLAKNDAIAAANRRHFAAHGVLAVNLVSSPGSGKTTLLVKTIEALRGRCTVAVIEGDQETSLDADRIRAAGAPAVQVNTGKGCHLDAAMVDRAFHQVPAPEGGVLMIENVGNLVCPAAFDLGESERVVVLSVTEGDDKPLKYPDIFRGSSLVLFNKCDLLPYVEFDTDRCLAHARKANPAIRALEVSATKGQGMDTWFAWILERLPRRRLASPAA